MNKGFVAALVVLGVASALLYALSAPAADRANGLCSFEQFKSDYGKRYAKEGEEHYRKNIFLRNLIKIQEHNANPGNTYTLGVNQFADLTQTEFEAIYLTLQVPKRSDQGMNIVPTPSNEAIDWTAKGMVTAVKNQGSCGASWAFSATGATESGFAIKSGQLVSLSEQQLIDCSRNNGCNAGTINYAYQYINLEGLTTSEKYPYVGQTQKCKIDGGEYMIYGFTSFEGCVNILNALFRAPVSVAVDASTWSTYSSGILSNCGHNINHAALVVGATNDYLKVKNSWGTSWGQNGYIRIEWGNTCGICQYGSYPSVPQI